jgi:hypothetical protein
MASYVWLTRAPYGPREEVQKYLRVAAIAAAPFIPLQLFFAAILAAFNTGTPRR